MHTYTQLANDGVEAVNIVRDLKRQGFSGDDIYVLAHDDNRTSRLAKSSDASQVGPTEEGFFDSIANFFRTRGDELRNKMEALGIGPAEADRLESELDRGKVLVMARR